MACCGLCRPKVKPTIKTKNNITRKKVNTIDTWMDNIEGPYESIALPSKQPTKPKKITNKQEIDESKTNDYSSDNMSVSSGQSEISQSDNQSMRSEGQNTQYLSSELSTSEDRQSATSKNDSVHNPQFVFYSD